MPRTKRKGGRSILAPSAPEYVPFGYTNDTYVAKMIMDRVGKGRWMNALIFAEKDGNFRVEFDDGHVLSVGLTWKHRHVPERQQTLEDMRYYAR